MRRRLFAVVLLLAMPLFGVVLATPVSAQTLATIDVTSAKLSANGAAVDVGLTVTCEAGYSGSVYVSPLSQAVSKKSVAIGYGSQSLTCTGQPQILPPVFVGGNSVPFRKGIALADAYLSVCAPPPFYYPCQDAHTHETVNIDK